MTKQCQFCLRQTDVQNLTSLPVHAPTLPDRSDTCPDCMRAVATTLVKIRAHAKARANEQVRIATAPVILRRPDPVSFAPAWAGTAS